VLERERIAFGDFPLRRTKACVGNGAPGFVRSGTLVSGPCWREVDLVEYSFPASFLGNFLSSLRRARRMVWLVLTLGVALFLAGIAGQIFGLRKRAARPEDRRVKVLVLRIVSAVAGLWLVFFSISHAAHLGFTGRW
jgi:hypothetical protein